MQSMPDDVRGQGEVYRDGILMGRAAYHIVTVPVRGDVVASQDRSRQYIARRPSGAGFLVFTGGMGIRRGDDVTIRLEGGYEAECYVQKMDTSHYHAILKVHDIREPHEFGT